MNMKSDPARLFGKGISFPPRIGDDGRWAWSAGADNIRESIRIILLTALEERIMLPGFGCGLQNYLFEPNTVATRRLIEEAVRQALGRWEPRIHVQQVAVEEDEQDPTSAIVTIYYQLVATLAQERLRLTVTFGTS